MKDYEEALHIVFEKAKKYDELINLNNTKILNCSFCGKDQDSVNKLIAGPGVYICNECISLCNEIIEDEREEENETSD
ncbi:hypothetical protein J1TS3_37010 [Siminovitchia fordii]|uniref:ClpX-type ZB domain-containing protein n=1 Tax=Siminovitchia fordii TaxID=254759 RepID=A0ABQ4KA20_9BACI|nr:hypothetical protein J1TS3_37010 [Siminovitchia fordii]